MGIFDRRKKDDTMNKVNTTKGLITHAYAIGDSVYLKDELISSPLRAIYESELRLLGAGASGISDEALSQAIKSSVPAMACVNYFATTATSVPLAISTNDVVLDFHPFPYFISQSKSIIELSVKSLLIWGKVYLRKMWNDTDSDGNPAGYPTGLEFIHPNNIHQRLNSNGEITEYVVSIGASREVISIDNMIYIADFDISGDGNPLSRLETAFTQLGVEQGIATFALALFMNSAKPAGIISFENTIDENSFNAFKEEWKNQYKGSKNAHKTAFVNGGNITWTPITGTPEDLAMPELTDNAKQMIVAAFSVPPELVGLSDNSGSSLSQEQITATLRMFLQSTVIPTIDKILDALNNQWLHIDFSPPHFYSLVTNEQTMPIFSEMTGDRVNMSLSLLQAGTIDYNQQLTMLGIEPVASEDGDIRLLRPVDMPMSLYGSGMISLNNANKMLGLPLVANDRWIIDGKTVLATEVDTMLSPAPEIPDNNPPPEIPLLSQTTTTPEDDNPFYSIIFPVSDEQAARSISAISLAIDFSAHNFVKMAARQLSKLLTDINSIEWVSEDDWKLELLNLNNCTFGQVTDIMRSLDLSDRPKVELIGNGYVVKDNAVYWQISDSTDLRLLRSSLLLDVRDRFDIDGDAIPATGIKLCSCDTSQITDEMLSGNDLVIDTPLVVDNVGIYIDGQLRHKLRMERITSEQRSELSKWREKFRTESKRGKCLQDVEFEILYLPQHVVDYVNETVADNKLDINSIFAEARNRLNMRAIQVTLLDFELFLEAIIKEARGRNIDRSRFTALLRNGIMRYSRLAYRDGLIDGGVIDGEVDSEDKTIIEKAIKEKQVFAKELSARIFSESGISEAEATSRPGIWGKDIVLSMYNAGRLSADKNGMYECVRAMSTVDRCKDCVRLEGQVHRLKDWARRGLLMPLPGKQKTECEGWNCGHALIPTQARAKGRF